MTNVNFNPDTYCSLAFAGFDSRAGSVCCWVGSESTIRCQTFAQVQTLPIIKKLQEDLSKGIKSNLCRTCWNHESVGNLSMRQSFTQKKSYQEICDEIEHKKLKHLVLDSGNICNLSCRTCWPDSSSSLIKEFEQKSNYSIPIKRTDISNLVKEDLSQLVTVSVLGGEPFQNLDHLQVLEKIIKQGQSKNTTLSYVTNGTVKLSHKIQSILNEFSSVGLTISIDAVGLPFEYIRTNGIWHSTEKNINELYQMSQDRKNIYIDIHPTISALNILYLDELFEWIKNYNFNYTFVFCEGPQHYSLNIFDSDQKNVILDKLSQSKFNMQPIIDYVKNTQFNSQARSNFTKEIEFTKNYKGLDITDYLPRLTTLLKL